MSKIRPVFIVNRFWPLFDGTERTLADLAVEMHSRGVPCTILAAHCHPSWPKSIKFHGIAVHRTAAPPPLIDSFKARLATGNYVRAITRWLRHNRDAYNLVFASSLKHEAYAAMSAFGRGSRKGRPPVVLRAERPGRDGDCLWQLDAPGGRRLKRRLLKADAFIAPSMQIHRELIAAGYARERIHYLPHSVRCIVSDAAKSERQKKAREAIASVGEAFHLPAWAPLAVFTGRLVKQNCLMAAVDAWPAITARWPNARLWIAGEGPERAALQAKIEDRNLFNRVVLTGAFDNVGDLLDAADVFISPSPLEDLSAAVLEAMAAGLPVAAPDNPSNRELIGHGIRGLLYTQNGAYTTGKVAADGCGECRGPGEAVARLFDNRELACRLGEAGRKLVTERFDLVKCVESYITLFEETLRESENSMPQP